MGTTTIRAEVEIQQPVSKVFAYCIDVGAWSRWQSRFAEVQQVTAGAFGPGTKIRTVTTGMGRNHEGVSDVTGFEIDRLIRFSGESDVASFESTWTFAQTPKGGARVEVQSQFTPREGALLARLLQPFVRGVFQRRLDADLESMRLLLENPV